MVYVMKFYVDGACPRNGKPDAIGAAAAGLRYRNGNERFRTRHLDTYYRKATNQRAEILAIILALEWVMDIYEDLNNSPRIKITIHSDSKYAVNCMRTWIYKWMHNEWKTSAEKPVANQDLIKDAITAQNRVLSIGKVVYKQVSRDDVYNADKKCKEVLKNM